MDAERWRRIDALFDALLELTEDRHEEFLQRTCGDDPEMRRELERLLDLERRAGSFMAQPAARLDEPLQEAAERDEVSSAAAAAADPTQIGPYRILRRLGRGGMGSVYLGQRDDQSFQRQVAIKVIRADRHQPEVRRRFRTEQQVLAGLVHPNIARLYDGGTTDDGFPYLVMEYVEGWPLDAFCDRHRWTLAQRLQLFRQVCDAVHYAHRSLVVHRDLKPGNILVTADGVPKLLDFGIAKLLQGDDGATHPRTRTGWSPMTPSYASPEQIRGDAITTASDTFALGVILYRLLTGVAPFGESSDSNHMLERAVLEEEPPRPSEATAALAADGDEVAAARRLSPRELSAALRGDLDTILAMALRKESDRRYGTAEALSADLGAYSEDRPVKARPETVGYRLGKWIRRNRLAAAAVVTTLLAVSAFIALSMLQNRRLEEQRDIARSERALAEDERAKAQTEQAKAEQISQFLLQLFADADPDAGEGDTLTVRQVVDRGAEKIDALDDQPEIQAAYRDVIGRVYRSLGIYDAANRLLEDALAQRRELHGELHEDVLRTLDALAGLRQDQGDYDGAEALFRQTLDGRRDLLGEGHPAVAESLNNLALLFYDQGEYDEAEPIYLELLEQWERYPGVEPANLATALNNLGLLVHDLGRLDEAAGYYRRSLDIKRRIGEGDANISTSLHNLATVLLDQKNYREAEPLYLESLEIRRRIYGEVHPAVAVSLNNLGVLYYEDGRGEAAAASLLEALDIWQQTVGKDHPRHAVTAVSYGRLLLSRQENEAAAGFVEPALDVLDGTFPPGHWRISYARLLLATCWSRRGEVERAEPWIKAGYEPIAEQLGAEESRSRDALTLIIEHYERRNDSDQVAHYRSML